MACLRCRKITEFVSETFESLKRQLERDCRFNIVVAQRRTLSSPTDGPVLRAAGVHCGGNPDLGMAATGALSPTHAGCTLSCGAGFTDLCGGGFAYLADSLVDHGVKQLVMVQLGLALDVFAGLSSCRFAGGENEVALLGGEGSEVLHHVEELVFAPAAHPPGFGHGEGEKLLDGPGVSFGSLVCIRFDVDGRRWLRGLLGDSGESSHGEHGGNGEAQEQGAGAVKGLYEC